MNKLIVLAALTMAGAPAFASKARVNSLGGSRQLVDVQYTFERPYLLGSVGELATMEWGGNGTASPHAEGGLVKKSGDGVYGVYFGRKSDVVTAGVAAFNAGVGANGALLAEQNPINFMYSSKMGDMTWGASLKYSNGKTDANDAKVSSMGVALGATNGTWEAELVQGLGAKSEATNVVAQSLEMTGNTKLGFGYNLSEMMHAYLDYQMIKAESKAAATTTTTETTIMNVGFVNTLVKNEEANFFYGVAYHNDKVKDGAENTRLPVWLGVEANATSWMVMRASLIQNVLINEAKSAAGAKSDVDSIALNAGAGIKLGKGMLDATFSTVAAGTFNYAGAGFLANTSYTYSF